MVVCTPLIQGEEWSSASNVSACDLLFKKRIQDSNSWGDRGDIFRSSSNRRGCVHVLFLLGLSLRRPGTRG